MISLILLTGVCLTWRTRGIQFRRLGPALRLIFRRDPDGAGEISAFGALCTALSATIGTGNIVGTATAITLGGPGALLWMTAAALLGTATQYAEGLLAVKYRVRDSAGYHGGPFYYIEQGMGVRFRPLAKLFALFGTLAGFLGIGTITQINGITQAAESVLDPAHAHVAFRIGGFSYTYTTVIVGAVTTVLAALVLLGGIRRIAGVSEVLVPFMAGTYILLLLLILGSRLTAIPAALRLIVRSAFAPRAALGAGAGVTLRTTIRMGIARGIFSNESGLGSAPIAAAAVRGHSPVEQGLVTMTGTFFDTIVLCTLTGLAIVVTDVWRLPELEGVRVTAAAFEEGLPFPGSLSTALLALSLIFFAFSTIIGWNYYAEQCLVYLLGSDRFVRPARWIYLLAVFLGPYLPVSAVWSLAGVFNGLMAFPNLAALLVLAPTVQRETRAYLASVGKGRAPAAGRLWAKFRHFGS